MWKDVEECWGEAGYRNRSIARKKDQVKQVHVLRSDCGKTTPQVMHELDFPFDYSHQVPFPYRSKTDKTLINESFHQVFGQAASFLC